MIKIKNIKWDVKDKWDMEATSEREKMMIAKEIGLPTEVTLLKINYDDYNTDEIDDLLYRVYRYPAYKYDVEKANIDFKAQARSDKEYVEMHRSFGYEPVFSDEVLNLVVDFKPIAKSNGQND